MQVLCKYSYICIDTCIFKYKSYKCVYLTYVNLTVALRCISYWNISITLLLLLCFIKKLINKSLQAPWFYIQT